VLAVETSFPSSAASASADADEYGDDNDDDEDDDSDIRSSSHDPTNLSIQGNLYKKRGGFGQHMPNSWQLRYFMLKDSILSYFDSETSYRSRGRLDLSLPFELEISTTGFFEKSPTQYTMQITPICDNDQNLNTTDETWKLCAGSGIEHSKWVSMLLKCNGWRQSSTDGGTKIERRSSKSKRKSFTQDFFGIVASFASGADVSPRPSLTRASSLSSPPLPEIAVKRSPLRDEASSLNDRTTSEFEGNGNGNEGVTSLASSSSLLSVFPPDDINAPPLQPSSEAVAVEDGGEAMQSSLTDGHQGLPQSPNASISESQPQPISEGSATASSPESSVSSSAKPAPTAEVALAKKSSSLMIFNIGIVVIFIAIFAKVILNMIRG
jgi:hypothetical protein